MWKCVCNLLLIWKIEPFLSSSMVSLSHSLPMMHDLSLLSLFSNNWEFFHYSWNKLQWLKKTTAELTMCWLCVGESKAKTSKFFEHIYDILPHWLKIPMTESDARTRSSFAVQKKHLICWMMCAWTHAFGIQSFR